MVWVGDNYPQEYLTEEEQNGPTDDVLELREQITALEARIAELEGKVGSIVIGAGGALYAR